MSTNTEVTFAPYPCGCRPMGRFTLKVYDKVYECPSYVALCRPHSLEAEQREREQRKAYDAEHGEGAWEAKQIAAEAYS